MEKHLLRILKKIIEKCYLFVPKGISVHSQRVTKVYSLRKKFKKIIFFSVHINTNVVCNLFFDVISKKNKNTSVDKDLISNKKVENPKTHIMKSSKDSVILTDITFNHLLEEPTFDLGMIKHKYFSTSSSHPSHKKFFYQILKSHPKITLCKKKSKFEFYNQIAKALRKKCRRYVVFGDMRGLFPKVMEIAVRYMDSIDKMTCEACGKFLRFNKKSFGVKVEEDIDEPPTVEYPVLNHGVKFYHFSCCPDDIKSKIF